MPVRIADESGSSTQGTIAAGIRWAVGARRARDQPQLGPRARRAVDREVERAIAGDATAGRASSRRGAMNDGTRDPNINPWASDSPDAVRVGAVDDDGPAAPRVESRRLGRHRRARDRRRSNAAPRVAGAAAVVLAAHPAADRAAGAGSAAPRLHARGRARRRLALRPRRGRRGEGRRREGRRLPPGRRKAGRGAGVVGGSGGAIQCGEFCADRLDAGTVVTLTAAPDARQPLRPLARRLPRDAAGLRAAHRRADEGGRRLPCPVSSAPCREWSFWAEARRVSTSAARCGGSTRRRDHGRRESSSSAASAATTPACRRRRCCARRSCSARRRARRASTAGALDVEAIFGWRDWVTSNWDDAGAGRVARGADASTSCAARGASRGRESSRSDGQELEYDTLVVATGSSPVTPPVQGLEDVESWTTRTTRPPRTRCRRA